MNYKTRQPFPHAAYVEGQRNFTYFDRSLTSGLTDEIISSPGDFLYIDQVSTGVVSVELNMRQGGALAPIKLAAGGSIECDFASIKINATAQLGKIIRVIIGNGARIKSGGTVNSESNIITAVDGARVRTDEESAFIAYSGQPAVVGQYSRYQLFNPASNDKNVYVERLKVLAGASQVISICAYSTQLANGAGYAVNKKIGAPASTAFLRTETNATSSYDAIVGIMATTATASDEFSPVEPYCLPPGKGLMLMSQSVNTSLYGTFEFFEK